MMDKVLDAVQKFYEAQRKAEEIGQEEFTCPLCGGTAWWGRSTINNHLHCGCDGCDFRVIQ